MLGRPPLSLASLNINGLANHRKATTLAHYIRSSAIDLLAIQDPRYDPSSHSHHTNIPYPTVWATHVALFFPSPRITLLSSTIITERIISANVLIDNEIALQIICAYGPPRSSPERPSFIASLLLLEPHPAQITLGDMNAYPDPHIDHHPPTTCATDWDRLDCHWARLGLHDLLRAKCPTTRLFTRWDKAHGVGTRLDHILATDALLPLLSLPTVEYCSLSDHRLLRSTYTPPPSPSPSPSRWQLHTHLLHDRAFRNDIVRMWHYHLLPLAPSLSPEILWTKAKIRFAEVARAHDRRIRAQKGLYESLLQRNLAEMTANPPPVSSSDPEAWSRRRERLEDELRVVQTSELSRRTLASRERWLEQGERPTRYFYRQLAAKRAKAALTQVRLQDDTMVETPSGIAAATRAFYKDLYAAGETDPTAQNTLLSSLPPPIPSSSLHYLNEPFHVELMASAIRSLPRYKATGPDGLPAEFYQSFSPILTPPLHRLFTHAIDGGSLPASFHRSHTVLLHKKGDRVELANWRPIALINVDAKLLSSLLAARLQPLLPFLLHPSQTGFVRGRSIHDPLWSLETALQYAELGGIPGAIVFLDQQKAYDRVDHGYLFACLQRMGLEGPWLNLVRQLYTDGTTSILVNNSPTTPVDLAQGIRQGDPLSPLLYNIILEPLLAHLRHHLQGLPLPGEALKVSAYADDTMVCLAGDSDAATLLSALQLHAKACNGRVNHDKSLLLPLGNSPPPIYPISSHTTGGAVQVPRRLLHRQRCCRSRADGKAHQGPGLLTRAVEGTGPVPHGADPGPKHLCPLKTVVHSAYPPPTRTVPHEGRRNGTLVHLEGEKASCSSRFGFLAQRERGPRTTPTTHSGQSNPRWMVEASFLLLTTGMDPMCLLPPPTPPRRRPYGPPLPPQSTTSLEYPNLLSTPSVEDVSPGRL
jgi:exonuclease III